jgi:hypothetical protein
MITSDTIGKIGLALSEAQAEIKNPSKDKTATIPSKSGAGFRYTYADFATALETIRPVLAKHKIAIVQAPFCKDGFVYLESRLVHESGEYLGSHYPVGSFADHRTMGSALSYARRYALFPLIGVQGEDDDDGAADQQGYKPPSRPVANPVESICDTAIRKLIQAPTAATFEDEVKKARALWPRLDGNDRERVMHCIEVRRGFWMKTPTKEVAE